MFTLQNYAAKLIQKETSPKYYFMDTGLLGLMLMDCSSAQLENLVAIELIRRFGREKVFYFENNVEIDFYIPEEKLAIQVSMQVLDQIEKQLAKLEDVLDIKKLEPGLSVCRELIMIKIRALDTQRQAVMNVTEIFHGKIVDVTHDSMIIELIGTQDKLDKFIDLLSGYEILELARTGITGLTRGSDDVVMLD